jgi:uncharacterized membrane protein HdeD (DUF308 family)
MTSAEITAPRTGDAWTDSWWLLLLQGIASIIVGILLITDPGATLVTLVFFLGIYFFVAGIFELVQVFLDKSSWGWHLFGGVLGIMAGLAIVRHPLWSAVLVPDTLVLLVGLIGIIMGAVGLVNAFRGEGWGIGILAVISIVFGLMLLAVTPLVATWIVVIVSAVFALVGGVIAVIGAFRLRHA